MIRSSVHFCCIVSLGSLVIGCSTPGQSRTDPRQKLLDSWAEHVILPNYSEFVARAQALEDATEELCSDSSSSLSKRLKLARQTWWDLREPWKHNEVIKFGPYREEPLRIGPKLDFWPTRFDAIEEALESSDELDEKSVSRLGTANRGMPVAEYLLYEVESDDEETEFAESSRRCEYLIGVTQDITTLGKSMLDAWSPEGDNYVAELTSPHEGSMFGDLRGALSEIVNRLAFTVEDIRGDKLGRPNGEQSGGAIQPDLIESRPSARSIQDLLDVLRGVELFYFGAETPEEAVGLADYLPSEPRDFNAEMRVQLDSCREALKAIDPLEDALSESPEKITAAEDALSELQRFIQVDVVSELGFSVSFNDNDGD